MNKVYNPGCALLLYKPHYAERIISFLNSETGDVQIHKVCCHHEPKLNKGTQIINTCPGCDRRFGSLYEGISTLSLWEVLAKSEAFPFPDYNGAEMTIHDACPIRTKSQVHGAIRTLLKRMNINVIEPKNTRADSVCCGDNLYPHLPLEQVHEKMRERAASMPCEDVCVYCVSCIKSMHIGGKKPRYILDLLFNEETEAQEYDTVKWHEMVDKFIETH